MLPEDGVRERRTRVALDTKGSIIGFASYLISGNVAELDDLFVDPPWLGHGVGRDLVVDISSLVLEMHFESLEVTANPTPWRSMSTWVSWLSVSSTPGITGRLVCTEAPTEDSAPHRTAAYGCRCQAETMRVRSAAWCSISWAIILRTSSRERRPCSG